jgi:nucleotide-binding universal stress UspA family protein
MKSFEVKKILIPVDFSSTSLLAFEHGANLAKLYNAEVILLHVIEKNLFAHDIFLPEMKMINYDNLAKIAENKLNEIAESFDSLSFNSIVMVKGSRVSKTIVNIAKENNADLIVMGTHGVSGIEEFFIGSNAERVVIDADCPVLTIQDHARKIGFKNILVPIDDSVSSRQKLSQAKVLAKKFNAKVHVLGLLSDTEDESHVKTFKYKIQQVSDHLTSQGIEYGTQIVEGGDHSEMIIKHAESTGADLIIIMTEQEADSREWNLGLVAQKIVNHSKIPVLSVTAEGVSVGGMKNNPI